MKVGIIIKPNQKGQIVIPKDIRKALRITAKTPLHAIQRGYAVYLYPIKEVISEAQSEPSYLKVLERTKGTWQEDWEGLERRRREIELVASKKRKMVW
ncbi:MAG: AbrB/MazE/SpoVT family DNA-binding domain-containing protein [Candidatus Portnoybacteria bacterium]|nr:AbrB/MazE/SpoVT family DNA-binding domain-containing protein [Candidatus Portnoybacteria bacterium]